MKIILHILIILLLSGCSITNWNIWKDGNYGNKDTLPVEPFDLLEMANYCNESYRSANAENRYEIRNDEFSYRVKQDQGILFLFLGEQKVLEML